MCSLEALAYGVSLSCCGCGGSCQQAQQPGSGAEEGAAAAAAATPIPGSKFADIKAREAAARAAKGPETAEVSCGG